MREYAVFFDYDNTTYRLPVNPEQIETSSTLAIDKYEVLKLGQISVPTHMELKKYSFEAELPYKAYHYVETLNHFMNADEYLKLFQSWREQLVPVRFMAGMANEDDQLENNLIDTYVLFEGLNITEKAGEEGDKYVAFQLLEYKKYGKQQALTEVDEKTGNKKKTESDDMINPNNTGYYVVQAGDTLWAISKKYYGIGSKYTKIYSANNDIIKNPSLIYPGQKLVIPS